MIFSPRLDGEPTPVGMGKFKLSVRAGAELLDVYAQVERNLGAIRPTLILRA
jgi:hypothetical protein